MRNPLRRAPRPRRREWWEDHRNLSDLLYWLQERGDIHSDQVAYFVEKPWKWSDEWALFQRWLAGERCPADDCPFLEDECPSHQRLVEEARHE